MTTALVTTKGQIVIPAALRKRHNIRKGSRLFVEEKGDAIILRPVSASYFERESGYEKIKEILAAAAEKDDFLLMTAVNYGEVYYSAGFRPISEISVSVIRLSFP
jgi:AbrB family looped-hinge helix DNA binding protein